MDENENIILYNDDCFNIFPALWDNSVDLMILDLPYSSLKFGKTTACEWDLPIDLNKMWVEIKRILKPDGIVAFFCDAKFGYCLINTEPKWFKYQLTWVKSKKVGFLSCNKQPLRQTENIYIFKNSLGTYNPQKVQGKPYKARAHQSGTYYRPKGVLYNINEINNTTGLRFPSNILTFNHPKKSVHRTQKPVKLLEWLVKTYSNENETVMDFTMGSGSTGVACKNTNRKFIGIEKDEEIFNIAWDRIMNHDFSDS